MRLSIAGSRGSRMPSQKNREPRSSRGILLHVLQLWADPSDASRDPGDGRWRCELRLNLEEIVGLLG